MSDELLGTARRLARASPKKPRQSDLKRAVSSAYYALFHAVARNGADLLIGTSAGRVDSAWAQTYRALDHGFARSACGQLRNLGFSAGLCACGDAFIQLQQVRHDADYDPVHRVSRADALAAIQLAETAIASLVASDRNERKAFAVQLLLKRR